MTNCTNKSESLNRGAVLWHARSIIPCVAERKILLVIVRCHGGAFRLRPKWVFFFRRPFVLVPPGSAPPRNSQAHNTTRPSSLHPAISNPSPTSQGPGIWPLLPLIFNPTLRLAVRDKSPQSCRLARHRPGLDPPRFATPSSPLASPHLRAVTLFSITGQEKSFSVGARPYHAARHASAHVRTLNLCARSNSSLEQTRAGIAIPASPRSPDAPRWEPTPEQYGG